MDFRFNWAAISKAMFRQCDRQAMGAKCARCGVYFLTLNKGKLDFTRRTSYEIPRIPVERGGKKSDNIAIVCPKCYNQIGQDGTKEIPYSELPYFWGKV